MDVVTSFDALLQVVAAVMTGPTAETFRTLITGWVLAPRRTIRGMVRACGTVRHHAAFHRLFAAASWSIDRSGLAVFDLITRGNPEVFLTVDDTLLPRFGLKKLESHYPHFLLFTEFGSSPDNFARRPEAVG